jgi:hypothetical protein
MKLAPWFGLAAIAVLFGAIGAAGDPRKLEDERPLDLSGIDTLQVATDSAQVVIDATRRPVVRRVAWREAEPHAIVMHREGRTLALDIEPDKDGNRQGELHIVVPPTLRHLVLNGSGNVVAESPMTAFDIEVGSYLYWHGDVADLRVLHRAPRVDCNADCGDTLHFSGHIDALRVTTWDGNISLDQADALGPTTLALGPKGALSLQKVRRVPEIMLVPYDGKVPPPPPPPKKKPVAVSH